MAEEGMKLLKLDKSHLEYMRLPPRLWRVTPDKIPESVQPVFRRFLRDLEERMTHGPTVLLMGDPFVGKSAMAALACKRARQLRKTVQFFRLWEYRALRRNNEPFDIETSIVSRCMDVELLVFDDLTEDDANDSWYGLKDLLGLIRTRSDSLLTTIITTRLSEQSPVIAHIVDSVSPLFALHVEGPSQQDWMEED